ncbi:MAG: UDP-4-amino-4,6-dideoxy-N-acetyl-beta-L-altrosamine transaminase [Nitrospirae bacterium]|nr:UDP-4-amino-4,6-dideoxy-N-acetyl-beta-L-altrosamine transaminase [Nitrospirota bacterium]
MKEMVPYGRQDISESDIQAVVNVLRSDFLTQGPAVPAFEKAVADYCGAAYAVAVNSATSALHIACLAAGLGPRDWLWTSPNTFVASANCGLYCGAKIDFVDIDPRTYNLDTNILEQKLRDAEQKGRLPKIVVPVHFAGQSCDMMRIHNLAKRYGFSVVEDASHAIGGRYHEHIIGNCAFSDMTVFSFHPVKIITTGEGGVVLTNREDLYEKLIRLRSHGITRNPQVMQGESHGPWYYQQIDLGFNYRMNDMQAALGASQMGRLDDFVKRRHLIARRYNDGLKELPIVLPWQNPDTYSALHLYVIRLKTYKTSKTHRMVFEELRGAGIGVNLHYIPVHIHPYYRNLGFKYGDFPEAERYYQEAISIPIYFGLTDDSQNFVIDSIKRILQ